MRAASRCSCGSSSRTARATRSRCCARPRPTSPSSCSRRSRGSTTSSSWPGPASRPRPSSSASCARRRAITWPSSRVRSRSAPTGRTARSAVAARSTSRAGCAGAPRRRWPWGVRVGRRLRRARADRRGGRAGGRAGGEGRQPRRLPAQRRQHRRRPGPLPDVRRDAGARPLQPPALRLRGPHPRPVRAAGLLRRRAVRRGVGRRGQPQGLLPLQDGLQGTGGDLQLPERALERGDELARGGRPRLHRLCGPASSGRR